MLYYCGLTLPNFGQGRRAARHPAASCSSCSIRVRIPGEADDENFGAGAGFYLDATQEPWAQHFRMHTYVTQELPVLIGAEFPDDMQRESIFGHSMGGHEKLTIALKNPQRFRSLSALAPICAPSRAAWTQTAFECYLGADRETWKQYDASELVLRRRFPGTILVDQGDADTHLGGLRPDLFEAACKQAGQALDLRMRRL